VRLLRAGGTAFDTPRRRAGATECAPEVPVTWRIPGLERQHICSNRTDPEMVAKVLWCSIGWRIRLAATSVQVRVTRSLAPWRRRYSLDRWLEQQGNVTVAVFEGTLVPRC